MKYAAFFISLFILTSVQARTIFSFNDSIALQSISSMLTDYTEDLHVSYRISDKKNIIKDQSRCEQVGSDVALDAFKEAINAVLKVFPDEEIPYNEALNDMKDYLDVAPLTLCKYVRPGIETQVVTLYFFNNKDKIFLRIDKTTRP